MISGPITKDNDASMIAFLTLLHILFQLWQGKISYESPWKQMGIVQRAKTLEKTSCITN